MAKLLFQGTHGSDDPTLAVLPLLGAKAAADAGHEAEVFLLGEAVYLMKDAVADATTPVGWPKVGDVVRDLVSAQVPFYV